jgi:hypothetical protein
VRWFYGSFMAYPPRGTSPLTESFDGTVALLSRPGMEVWVPNTQGYREGSIVQSQFHRPAGFRLALGDLRGIGVRARPCPTIPNESGSHIIPRDGTVCTKPLRCDVVRAATPQRRRPQKIVKSGPSA